MRKIDLTNFQVATSETARQINRRITLNFLRHHQPMSRADLSRRSGLQRSTVSAIVDQLIEEGWVTEGAIGRLPRRRRRPGCPAPRRGAPQHRRVHAAAGDDHRGPGRRGARASRNGDRFRAPGDPVHLSADGGADDDELAAAHAGMVCEARRREPAQQGGRRRTADVHADLGWRDVEGLEQCANGRRVFPVDVEMPQMPARLSAKVDSASRGERLRRLVAVTACAEGIGVGVLSNGRARPRRTRRSPATPGSMTLDGGGRPC